MRPLPPIVVCGMLLLSLTASASLADPSIVADLDSNATNGPDTLQADVGDTVLVRVWITDSADSLLGFGITLGDTSGTLAGAEDDTDAVYTTPSAWANVPVQLDDDGRLLLQGYDFTFSEPLHIPCQVAQLKFVAVSPESCVVFSWNTAISGWQNWVFTEGTFASFEGAVVCVAGQEDGGGDEGEGGEGGEDDAPSAGPYPCERDLIEVMFAWDSRVRLRNDMLVDLESNATDGVDSLLASLASYSWRRITGVPEDVVDEMQETASRNLGSAEPRPRRTPGRTPSVPGFTCSAKAYPGFRARAAVLESGDSASSRDRRGIRLDPTRRKRSWRHCLRRGRMLELQSR